MSLCVYLPPPYLNGRSPWGVSAQTDTAHSSTDWGGKKDFIVHAASEQLLKLHRGQVLSRTYVKRQSLPGCSSSTQKVKAQFDPLTDLWLLYPEADPSGVWHWVFTGRKTSNRGSLWMGWVCSLQSYLYLWLERSLEGILWLSGAFSNMWYSLTKRKEMYDFIHFTVYHHQKSDSKDVKFLYFWNIFTQ